MDTPPDPTPPVKSAAQLAREARLAAALRENLRRRKAQARARADQPARPAAEEQD
ncbi:MULTISPECIES: hypothetical protein [Roseomonadaceae]|uniref:Uncharacterized protein n=1 Tax=Falsiroseomonas oleicola TaxID=2801474 RepID=A0ABS6H332_9PROT|nr:hypothetical protein [Roseomonas oleicola]MBU8543077.1 hypothetical protein [Roseomonas oleicola]